MEIISLDPCPGCGGEMNKVESEKTFVNFHKWICPRCGITREILMAQTGSENHDGTEVIDYSGAHNGDATK